MEGTMQTNADYVRVPRRDVESLVASLTKGEFGAYQKILELLGRALTQPKDLLAYPAAWLNPHTNIVLNAELVSQLRASEHANTEVVLGYYVPLYTRVEVMRLLAPYNYALRYIADAEVDDYPEKENEMIASLQSHARVVLGLAE